MMHKTHAAFAVCACSLAMMTAEPAPLLTAALASQLPDVDTSKSFIGRMLFPVSWFLERKYPHRTITHSFLASAIVAGIAYPLYFYSSELFWAVVLGYFVGWFTDVFTKTGVTAFYPASAARLVVPANPRLRLSTGSGGEYFLLLLIILATMASINVNMDGGIIRKFNGLLAQPSGAVDLYNKEGRTRAVIAHIVGHKSQSTVTVVDDFEVVEVLGVDLLVTSREGELFKAGQSSDCDITIERVSSSLGRPIKTGVQEFHLDEQDLSEVLRKVASSKDARVYITGDLTFKHARSLSWQQKLQAFNAVALSGVPTDADTKTAKLHAASLDELKKLAGYDASGNLLVRVVSYE